MQNAQGLQNLTRRNELMLASSGDAAAVMNFTAGRRLQDWLRYIQHFDCHAFTKKSAVFATEMSGRPLWCWKNQV